MVSDNDSAETEFADAEFAVTDFANAEFADSEAGTADTEADSEAGDHSISKSVVVGNGDDFAVNEPSEVTAGSCPVWK